MPPSKFESSQLKKAVKRVTELYNNGQMRQVVSIAEKLTKRYPKTLILYEILGAAYMGIGNGEKAIAAYKDLLRLNLNHPDAHNNTGILLHEKGRFEEAMESYKKAITIEPDFADAHYNLGNALKQNGDLKKSLESYKAAIAIDPTDAEFLKNFGHALEDYGEFDQAIEFYVKALKIEPGLNEIQAHLENAVSKKTEIEKLVCDYANFMELEVRSPEVGIFHGSILQTRGFTDAAIARYKQVLKIEPDCCEAYTSIATALRDKGKLDDALEMYNKALSFENDSYLTLHNMGITFLDKGNFEEAIKSFEKAIKKSPDNTETYIACSLAYLSLGNFEAGWSYYDWRLRAHNVTDTLLQSSKPRWTPDKAGSLLVWSEQGIGEDVMFASLIPDLHALCSNLIIQIDKRLIPLFKRSFPNNIEFRARDKIVSETEYDTHIPIGSLPQYFRQNADCFRPVASGWLSASNFNIHRLRQKLLGNSSEMLIGISWRSSSTRSGAIEKSIALNQLANTLHAPNIKLINLQYGPVDDEIKDLKKEFGIDVIQVPDIDNKHDIDELAALIMACDKVISIENFTIDLAGALGKEAEAILPVNCDWRWAGNGNKSYWYESVNLHRQTKMNYWDNILKKLRYSHH